MSLVAEYEAVVQDLTERIRDIDDQIQYLDTQALYQDTLFQFYVVLHREKALSKEQHVLLDQWNAAMNELMNAIITSAAGSEYNQFSPGTL